VSHGKRLSRGDNRRNDRLAQLRTVIPHTNAVLALDLADDKQVFALTDHDSRVSRAGRFGVATEPRGVVGFEVILGAYASLLSMAATDPVSLVS